MAWSTPLNHGITTSTNNPVTIILDTTGADFGIAYGNFQGTITIGDNKGNTWSGLARQTGNAPSQLWYMQGGTFGTNHQITMSGGTNPTDTTLIAACFSGSQASPFDAQSGSADVFADPSCQPGAGITPAVANELFLCGLSIYNNAATATIDSSFSVIDSNVGSPGVFNSAHLAYRIYSGTTLLNPTWTFSTPVGWSCPMAAFKAPLLLPSYRGFIFG